METKKETACYNLYIPFMGLDDIMCRQFDLSVQTLLILSFAFSGLQCL